MKDYKTVYILGAGSTISHSKNEYPDINTILIKANELGITVNKDKKPKYNDLNTYLDITFGKDLSNLGSGLDYEKLFTFIDIEFGKYPLDYTTMKWQLKSILIQLFNQLEKKINKTKKLEYEYFSELIKEKDTIITFNWDILLDDYLGRPYYLNKYDPRTLAERNKKKFVNNTKPQYQNLINSCYIDNYNIDKHYGYYLKLHGSVDWKICINKYCNKFNHPFPTFFPNIGIPCAYCLEKTDILIIPPSFQKSVNQIPFIRTQWNIAEDKILSANKIVIWGYSLPPTDFYAELLLRKARTNYVLHEITIINPCDAHVKNLENLFTDFVQKPEFNRFKYFIDFLDKIK